MTKGFKVTTKVIFKDQNCNVLILKKENTPSLNWDLPGGTVETDEQIEECIVRELKEELDVEIKFDELSLFNVYIVNRVNKPSLLVVVYTCDKLIENINLSDEHSDYIYADKKKIVELKEDTVIFRIVEEAYEKIK